MRTSLSSIGSIFLADGALAKQLSGFIPRPQQLEMALLVQEALEKGQSLAVEAGTGVGKSLAYLIPAALWAVQNEKKVWVATQTKALQVQLVEKDLPLVTAVLHEMGCSFRFALRMGVENYLCLQRLNYCATQLQEGLFNTDIGLETVQKVREWSETATTGLKTKIPHRVPETLWRQICRESEVCLGNRGPFWEKCLYRKDIVASEHADLLIVNQHLLFSGMPLTGFGALIIDEAHNLEEVVTQSVRFTNDNFKRLIGEIADPETKRGLVFRIRGKTEHLFHDVEKVAMQARTVGQDFFTQIRSRVNRQAKLVEAPDEGVACRIRKPGFVKDSLSGVLESLAKSLLDGRGVARSAEEQAEIEALSERCLKTADQVGQFLTCSDGQQAYWVECSPSRVSLHTAPIDAEGVLRKKLFELNIPIVLTSATLPRSKLSKELDLHVLDSPFNYQEQVGVYVDGSMPDPSDNSYENAVKDRCLQIIPGVPGGILVLFTSVVSLTLLYIWRSWS